jgi:hypothetical protein
MHFDNPILSMFNLLSWSWPLAQETFLSHTLFFFFLLSLFLSVLLYIHLSREASHHHYEFIASKIQNSKYIPISLDKAFSEPPWLPRSDPLWKQLFDREWDHLTQITNKKFISNWYKLISPDLNHDFINKFNSDMNIIGIILYHNFIQLYHNKRKQWATWLINDILNDNLLTYLTKSNKQEKLIDTLSTNLNLSSTSSIHPSPISKKKDLNLNSPSLTLNEPAFLLLNEWVKRIIKFLSSESIYIRKVQGSSKTEYIYDEHSSCEEIYELMDEKSPLYSSLLITILRDSIFLNFISKFNLHSILYKYLKSQNNNVNLNSLDLDYYLNREMDPIPSNLILPIIKIGVHYSIYLWEDVGCFLLLKIVNLPIIGAYLTKLSNNVINRLCQRFLHPWMLCQFVRYVIYYLEMDHDARIQLRKDSMKMCPSEDGKNNSILQNYMNRILERIHYDLWRREKQTEEQKEEKDYQHDSYDSDEIYIIIKMIDSLWEFLENSEKRTHLLLKGRTRT